MTSSSPTWKVMVYFAGQNHLAEDTVYSLKDMKSVGSNNNLTILAEYSARWLWKSQATKTDLATPLRFHIREEPANTWVVNDYIEPRLPRRPKYYLDELVRFIKWGLSFGRPAKYNMVILSGDGGGPVTSFLPSATEPEKKLKPFELHQLFKKALTNINQRIDVVGLDSCLMSTAEIGYELRKYADFLVSSQGNADDIGWPYRHILQSIKDQHNITPLQLVTSIVDQYNYYYVDYAMIAKSAGNLSALNLKVFDHLTREVRAFVTAANAILPSPKVCRKRKLTGDQMLDPDEEIFARLLARAHWVAQTYRQDQYTDLYDFCDSLMKEIELPRIQGSLARLDLRAVLKACQNIKLILCGKGDCSDSTGNQLVLKSCFVGAKYQYSRGLSLYFPWSRISETYSPYLRYEKPGQRTDYLQHSFPRATGWGRFLDRYICATKRPMRLGVTTKRYTLLTRDPPEGRGDRTECESAKNPSLRWEIAKCIPDIQKNL